LNSVEKTRGDASGILASSEAYHPFTRVSALGSTPAARASALS
jgi:hypothetical protein